MDLTVEYSRSSEKTPVLDKTYTDRKNRSHQVNIEDPSQEEEDNIENAATTELREGLAALRYRVFECNGRTAN